MSIVNVASAAEFRSILNSSSIVVTDFYADWCGPCKTIAPVYAQLATKHSSPKKVTFTKVDVDNQQEIARTYGVSAMPTFLIFRNGAVINTLRGADPRGLTTAVENAVKLAGAAKPSYSTPGRTLGGAPFGRGGQSLRRPISWNFKGLIQTIINFLGLYFISLFSLDPYISAERSSFNIHAPPPARSAAKSTRSSAPAPRKVGTLADLGGS